MQIESKLKQTPRLSVLINETVLSWECLNITHLSSRGEMDEICSVGATWGVPVPQALMVLKVSVLLPFFLPDNKSVPALWNRKKSMDWRLLIPVEQQHICRLWQYLARGWRGEEVWLCFVPKFRVRLGLALPSEGNQFQQLQLKSGKIKAMAKGKDLCALRLPPKIWTNFFLEQTVSSSKLL